MHAACFLWLSLSPLLGRRRSLRPSSNTRRERERERQIGRARHTHHRQKHWIRSVLAETVSAYGYVPWTPHPQAAEEMFTMLCSPHLDRALPTFDDQQSSRDRSSRSPGRRMNLPIHDSR